MPKSIISMDNDKESVNEQSKSSLHETNIYQNSSVQHRIRFINENYSLDLKHFYKETNR